MLKFEQDKKVRRIIILLLFLRPKGVEFVLGERSESNYYYYYYSIDKWSIQPNEKELLLLFVRSKGRGANYYYYYLIDKWNTANKLTSGAYA